MRAQSGSIGRQISRNRRVALLLGCAAIAATASPAAAQTVPDAGSLQRELRQGLPGGTPRSASPPPASTRDVAAPTGDTVQVDRFVIEGATLVPLPELEAATRGYIGRPLDLQGLQAAAQAVADVYRRHGYFARTLLPPQDASAGTVRIQVVEGRFGQILLDNQAKRADPAFVSRVVGGRLAAGQPYSADALERGILLANDLPGIRADGVLKAGSAPGTSDLALTVRDAPLVSGSIGADNGGVETTGRYRGIATLAFNDLTGTGDQLTLLGLGSERLGYGQIGYSLAIGSGGWRAGVYTSYLRYTLGGDFAALDGRGNADTQGVELTYPILRTSAATARFRIAYEHGHYHDELFGAVAHNKQVHRVALSLSGDAGDGLGGGGRTRYDVAMTLGTIDLSGAALDRLYDQLTARVNGAYGKLAAELIRDQRLGAPAFLRVRVASQLSLANLDSSEQFALGGPYGVRAYPVNEALGDRGVVANVELHLPVNGGALGGIDFYGFVDGGITQRHADPWLGWGGPGDKNSYGIAGAGAGVSYPLPGGITVSGVIAAPIGANPGGPDDRHNQDGSRRRARGWFTVSKTF
ncbi:ShlB/FhaC/HecB family hemolysin secretion/activation protein [Sphingomonas sp. HITSZ_GF]|uniref:ShlB/FhaC/HecB family hemolysin secretion/activation protein n=1 Tax=Sphingomonas sp. HITSZ_GF TaxID=3037247 RepID=UPI00240D074D|nr:ShlB/FhaC/HecB family hemolysin secretion/activation protein [Sphingomonas sp. HITSZ_GF]MDG2535296.1 ShlB/FhaC/HecB family hemolysin secretion/activation protein [Sphingomonas sp. HITSZ_GF]